MKILVMLSLFFNMSYLFSQENNPITMLTKEEYKKAQSISPALDKLAEDIGYIARNAQTKDSEGLKELRKNSLKYSTVLAVEFVKNPKNVNDEMVKRLCGDWGDAFDTLSTCSNNDYLDKLQQNLGLGDNDPIHTQGTTVYHCYNQPEGDPDHIPYYCFNGQLVKADRGNHDANRLMMGYLCTDEKVPMVKDEKGKVTPIVFGGCVPPNKGEKADSIITEEMSCYCQYVNGIKSNGAAWNCYPKS